MTHQFWATFLELLRTPFQHVEMVWGIVPLYFAWMLNEMTPSRANFRTAGQTGFSFLWAAAQWLYPWFRPNAPATEVVDWKGMGPINLVVTSLVIAFGAAALICGLARRFPRYAAFLGYMRFSNYFMIAIYPMQAPGTHTLAWTWERLAAIGIFAVPIWLVLHFGLMPVRSRT